MKKFFKVTGIALAGVVVGIAGCIIAEKNGINIGNIVPTSSES